MITRLVDVGGHRLSARIAGAGTPVVVFEAQFGGTKASWRGVWREVAAFTTVCLYDRAGLGASEPGPRPGTAVRATDDLRRLLSNLSLPPPFVLVGHSFGGLIVQVFARRFPHLVGGVVLVDASHPDQLARLSPFMTSQARADSRRLRIADNPEHLAIGRSEAQARRAGPFPAVPLRVLSAPPWPSLLKEFADTHAARAVLDELAAEQARLSPLGTHIRVARTGHSIQLDRPGVVIRNIRMVVEAVRATAGGGATA